VSTLTYSKRRVGAFLEEIARIRGVDFPYGHTQDALNLIEQAVKVQKDILNKTGHPPANTPAQIQKNCSTSLQLIWHYLPFLGFILRSTDVKNAFEVYGPLLRIARGLLGPDVVLVVSSEWDFSPYVYKEIPQLPNLVMIGMPASEAGNPLLLPLAGHELGHAVWSRNNVLDAVNPALEASILQQMHSNWSDVSRYLKLSTGTNLKDLSNLKYWSQALLWAQQQAEETFCDFLGLRIFGESFTEAHLYLLTPSVGSRSPEYPSLTSRAANMRTAAISMGINMRPDYVQLFVDQPSALSDLPQYWCRLADNAAQSVVSQLVESADMISTAASIPLCSYARKQKAFDCYRRTVPAYEIGTLSDILNAGWDAAIDENVLRDNSKKDELLRELILKSIEVLEIEHRTN